MGLFNPYLWAFAENEESELVQHYIKWSCFKVSVIGR